MVNISTESVMAQKVEKEEAEKQAQAKKKVVFKNFAFDEKHYLNTRLAQGEAKKEIVVRLLPFSETELSPFKKIYVHSVKVLNENGEKVWKKFICPIGMEKGSKCPFCETAQKANKLKYEATDEALKDKYNAVQFMNEMKEYWIVRCIDRAHEDEGVKFWRFPDARNGDGIWDKIYDLFEAKRSRGVEIFDLYEGKDLVVTVKRNVNSGGKEKMVYTIQDDEKTQPLSQSEEQMEKWVYDPMTWEDVYSIKDYDYMSIALQGDYPVWNKEFNKWVGKHESEKIKEEAKQQEIQDNLQSQSQDFSSFTVDNGAADSQTADRSLELEENDSDDLLF